MGNASRNARLQQRPALSRVVAVIFERILDAFGYDDRASEMHDGAYALLGKNARKQVRVLYIAFIERDIVRYGEFETRRKIVYNGNGPACIAQGEDGVAADITGASGDKNRYGSIRRG